MKKYLPLLLFIGLAFAQDDSDLDIIEMESGIIYKGKITQENPFKIFMLQKGQVEEISVSKRKVKKVYKDGNKKITDNSIPSDNRYDDRSSSVIDPNILLENAGNDMMFFVSEYYKSMLIGIGGYFVTNYGLQNPIEISSAGDEDINPLVYAGSALIIISTVKQILNYRKLYQAGKKLNEAGKLLQNN